MNELDALKLGEKFCETIIRQYKVGDLPPRNHFHYHQGVFLSGVYQIYLCNNKEKYWDYIQSWLDYYVVADGTLRYFDERELDDVQPGILFFPAYLKTRNPKYISAIKYLQNIVLNFPKNDDGGFWHKFGCKDQMWLDGLYMAGPFLAESGTYQNDTRCFEECITQALLMEEKTKDEATGLWFHAWDSKKVRPWADIYTGLSSEFWGRSIAWVPIALLDELDYIPENYTKRDEIIRMLVELLSSISRYQHSSGYWFQVLDKGDRKDNWLETSCTCLFAAAFSKAYRKGYIGESAKRIAVQAYKGVSARAYIESDCLIVPDICVGTGVGDYQHYINRPRKNNDLHGAGAFLLMCAEIHRLKNYY